MRSLSFSMIWFTVLTICLGVRVAAGEENSAPKPGADDTFLGKILVITQKPSRATGIFAEVQVRKLADRTYLVGKLIDTVDDQSRWHGIKCWVPLEDIGNIVEFPSVAQARAAVAEKTNKLQKYYPPATSPAPPPPPATPPLP